MESNDIKSIDKFETEKKENKKYLIIITDMDDDIGRKANIKTPILGREDCINTAIKLGLSDPGDTDTNSILGGIKLYDELKKEGYDVEVAIVSGHKNVESEKCAKKIKEQLDFLMYLYEPDFIYLVSDGKEDELILNYIDRKDVFVWKKRIIVKQSESLESTYYLVQEFLKKTMSQYVPFIFTAIGFTLVIYAIFAGLGWRIIAGMVGLYILSEGSGFIKSLKKSIKEGKESLEFGKIAPVGNVICWIIIIAGGLYAYSVSQNLELIDAVGTFIYTIADPLALGVLIYITIHFIDDVLHTTKNLLMLLKGFFFKILIIFMSRELLIEFSQYLDGKVSFMMISIYVVVYTSILIILSAILFYVQNDKKENSN
jgi:putative membrane protein